jgi:hypothetical protein
MARAEPGTMRTYTRSPFVLVPSIVGLISLSTLAVAAAGETFTATAQVKSAGGVTASAPVTVSIDRLSTDADRDALIAAVKKGGTDSARALLLPRPPIGTVKVGANSTAIKYAYARPGAGGRVITIVTGSPIAYVGASVPGAPAKSGFYLGLLVLDVPASGAGHGELSGAAKVTVNDQGAIVTQDYSGEVVQLQNVTGK